MGLNARAKTYSTIGLFLLVAVLLTTPAKALTPSGGWGVSVGDELYYAVNGTTYNDQTTYWKYEVTEVTTGGSSLKTTWGSQTYLGGHVMTKVYSFDERKGYQQAAMQGSLEDYPIAVYDTDTGTWTGAIGLLANQPSPAPNPLDISMVNNTMMTSFSVTTIAATWGTVTYTRSGNTLTYSNGTDTLSVTYSDTGICTSLVRKHGDTTLVSVTYYSSDPAPEPTGDIPGPGALVLLGTCGLAVAGLIAKFRAKRRA
ncbi:MAG: hypothetical protein ACTSU5_09535 [Promethearchaeota archaeon]